MAIGLRPTIAELLNTLDSRITKYIKYKNPINYNGHLLLSFVLTLSFQRGHCFSNHALIAPAPPSVTSQQC